MIGGLVCSLFVGPFVARAQPVGKTYRVAYLTVGSATGLGLWKDVLDGLRELGYVEGQNLAWMQAHADGKVDRLPGLVASLVQWKADVIVTTSTSETMAAKTGAPATPIVMTLAPDPVEQGLVASLARPGGTVTGLTNVAPGLSRKYIELLHEAIPSATRFTVVHGPIDLLPVIRENLRLGAETFGIRLSFVAVNDPHGFDVVLAHAKQRGASGIIAPLNSFTWTHRAKLAQAALKHRLPGIYWERGYVEEGGLMSYSANFAAVGRRASYFVDRILKGTKPADLPVEQPTSFNLVINESTAKALGITLPQSLRLRADEIIQ